ncbi:MAG TPA: TIGR03790 family protein [Chthoniobacterales bacterium]|nr:TIGR03790 family protein [Chthoniobacterales bacterium]
MNRRFLFAILIVFGADALVYADQPLAPATIVIFNKDAPDSVALARFYAQQRGIQRDHLVGLACSFDEEIGRDEYDVTIANPLREIFEKRNWWTLRTTDGKKTVTATTIRFVAVIKGVPLKVRPTATPYPGDEPGTGPINTRNEASVDSELSVLGYFSPRISGLVVNPYFQSYRAITEFEDPALLLVGRLDAPTVGTVRRMITDAIAAEKNGLWGRGYVDAAHNTAPGFEIGDKWMADIQQQLRKTGIPVVFEDTPAIFPSGYPMSDCALYYGWYSSGISGPFMQVDFRFAQGAVAVHIHSYSATSLRDPGANWVGPLLARGATASLGNVYEPYLQLTTHLDIFNDRLLHGFTFAESACMATLGLSWMNVAVGDPLYRPYASWMQIDSARDSGRSASVWKMYHDFAVKNSSLPPADYRLQMRQVALRTRNGPMIEDLGLIEMQEGNFVTATNYFQMARGCYSKRDDIMRAVLEEADGWIKQKKPKRALELVRSTLRIVPDTPAAPLLRQIEQEIIAPPPPPVPPTASPTAP